MRPRALLISEYNYLSSNIYRELLNAGCEVHVYSKDRKWATNAGVVTTSSLSNTLNPTYLVVVHNDTPNKLPREIVDYISHANTKVVVVFAAGFDMEGINTYPINVLSTTAKTFVLSDVFGSDLDENGSRLQNRIASAVKTGKVSIPSEPTLYALNVQDVVAEIVKELFTYWSPKFIYLANIYSWHDLAHTLASKIPALQINQDSNYKLPAIHVEKPSHMSDIHFSSIVSTLIEKYKPAPVQVTPVSVSSASELKSVETKKRPAKVGVKPKYLVGTFLIVLFALATPLLSVVASGLLLKQALSSAKSGSSSSTQSLVNISQISAEYARGVSRYLPLHSQVYKLADLEIRAAQLLTDGMKLASVSKTISNGLIGKEGYDLSVVSRDAGLLLSRMYYDISDIEVKVELLPDVLRSWADGYISDIETSRKYILSAQKIVEELPEVLGATETKRYLVLLQNNMELRPTGGFIGSFAIVTLEHGKLIDTEVMDVYAADGQLQGYVEPPAPIRDYLGEASWHMRDSNWSPDFPTSAIRAEWFLDKTINRKVDGVIAINLETAKSILRAVGPVTLRDYGDSVTADNLYERVQYEVENDFFPGSKKKANYLTALTSALVDSIKTLNPDKYSLMSKELIDRLDARDIQIFMHNKTIEEIAKSLRWDGAITANSCAGNCESIELGFVEANVGVNKANYHVERNSSIVLSYVGQKIVGEMTTTIINTSSRDSSVPDNRYKNYLRAFAPKGAVFQRVDGETPEVEELDNRVEAGILVDINPGEKKTIQFKWTKDTSLDFKKSGMINLLYWKQSGVNTNPTQISFKFPDAGRVKSEPALSLTKDGSVGYNTELIGDFLANVSWEGKK